MPVHHPVPVVMISGSVGVGKSALALAAHEQLSAAEIPSAFLDLDCLTCLWPPVGPYNEELVLSSLKVLWPLYRDCGAQRLILARVIERKEDLRQYSNVLEGADITLVRLTASEAIRKSRLISRETGDALNWHLARTVELERILEEAALEQYLVTNEDRPVGEVADTMLRLIGWIQ